MTTPRIPSLEDVTRQGGYELQRTEFTPGQYVPREQPGRVIDNTMYEVLMPGEYEPEQLLDINGRPARIISCRPTGQVGADGIALSNVVFHPLTQEEIDELVTDDNPDPFGGILDAVRRPGFQRPAFRPNLNPNTVPSLGRPHVPPSPDNLLGLNERVLRREITPQQYLQAIVEAGDGSLLASAEAQHFESALNITRGFLDHIQYRDRPEFRALYNVIRSEVNLINEMRASGTEPTVQARAERHRQIGAEEMVRLVQAGMVSPQTAARRVMGVDWAAGQNPGMADAITQPAGTATTDNGVAVMRRMTREDFVQAMRDMQTRMRDVRVEEIYINPQTMRDLRSFARDELGGDVAQRPMTNDPFIIFGHRVNTNRSVPNGMVLAAQEMTGGALRAIGLDFRREAAALRREQGDPAAVHHNRAAEQELTDMMAQEMNAEIDQSVIAGLREANGLPNPERVRGTRSNAIVIDEEFVDGDPTFTPGQDYGPNRNGDVYTGGADQAYTVEVRRPFADDLEGEDRMQMEGMFRALNMALNMFGIEAGLDITTTSPETATEVVWGVTLNGRTIGQLVLQAGVPETRPTPPRVSPRRQTLPEDGERALEI